MQEKTSATENGIETRLDALERKVEAARRDAEALETERQKAQAEMRLLVSGVRHEMRGHAELVETYRREAERTAEDLAARAERLTVLEQRMARLRRIAWISLVIGLTALVLAGLAVL